MRNNFFCSASHLPDAANEGKETKYIVRHSAARVHLAWNGEPLLSAGFKILLLLAKIQTTQGIVAAVVAHRIQAAAQDVPIDARLRLRQDFLRGEVL